MIEIDEFEEYERGLKEEFEKSYNESMCFIVRVLNKSGINCEDYVLKQKIKEFAIEYFIECYDIDTETIDFSSSISDDQFIDFCWHWTIDFSSSIAEELESFEDEAINFLLEHYRNIGYTVNYSPRFRYKPYEYFENLNDYEDLPDDIFMSLWKEQICYDRRIQINRETRSYSLYYKSKMKILENYK